jgi:phosphopantothenoylcysteine decarboxylase/phosphopantothenate--cysteine ligase
MRVLITAGPTYEPLDEVRRLTNFSTGQLGTELASFLVARGHEVVLLRGYYAIHQAALPGGAVEVFTTTDDLRERLRSHGGPGVGAVFHAAAVSDFGFAGVFERGEDGVLRPCPERKVSTRGGAMFAALRATPKILAELRGWYPAARLVGWKYELDGDRSRLLGLAERQMRENRSDACVINGAAYGAGFGVVTPDGCCEHQSDRQALFAALARLVGG